MSATYAILFALGICAISALLEGVCAGHNVKPLFARLRFPAYSIPLPGWYVIGALYYVICFVISYRLLRHAGEAALKYAALALSLLMMGINALWNYVFFRRRNLFLSLLSSVPYSLLALALVVCLLRLDHVAAWSFVPYLFYLIYANWWGYSLWKLNGAPK